MDIKYFKKYISVKTKKHWVLIGNVYGKGFTIVNWNKQTNKHFPGWPSQLAGDFCFVNLHKISRVYLYNIFITELLTFPEIEINM